MSEITEWVIKAMLITGAGMFVIAVGVVLTYLCLFLRSLYLGK